MRILHCISGLSADSGGPARSVPALADAVARIGTEVQLAYVSAAQDVELNGNMASPLPCQPSWPRTLGASRELRRRLIGGERFDIYHAHGLWEFASSYTAQAARRNNAPFLLTPRGMLEPWALSRSRWQKRALGWLYQNRDLHHADCLHAITTCEVESFRAYGLKNPIAVVPNGVDLASCANLDALRGRAADLYPMTRDRSIALFLSRLHPKKGLLHLMEAWANVHPEHPNWILLVTGPDDLGHQAEVERKVARLGISSSVLFTGPMYGEDKIAALAAAKCFVLPSFSEGFSMAVLEALAWRLPVLITPGCNFPEVVTADAGVMIEPNARGTAEGLRRLMRLSESERVAMGKRGRQLVEERYTWHRVGAQMIDVYEWLLNGGKRPECVVL
jgi:poly(glycerol-phosphate) alpha-glucosyltransferase